ncbi:glycosyltransferase family 4 protein [Formosa sp. L2A11]|uniref:glycosyltransferase family 4 protein n=1 Tax=Formosa sp. L2A11 TaxID=2686363 RepID=UPI00131E3234|nr:glycosyltransferase [Formosa sp. L2A11]
MPKKEKILIFIDWFLPGYKAGGPIQSVNNIVFHLHDEFDISIVTSNKDLGESAPYKDLEFNTWQVKTNYKVMYLDDEHQNSKLYKKLIEEEDYNYVYFNSLFSVKFTLLPLWTFRKTSLKQILAPRGMVGKGALAIKPLKKKVFISLFKLNGLHKKVVWHATSGLEKEEIEDQFGHDLDIRIAPNLSSKMGVYQDKEKEVKSLNVFFLSRIALKKNLLKALEYLSHTNSDYKIKFSIIGPIDEADYWQSCEAYIKKMPKHVEVTYLGAIPNYKLKDTLKNQHVLLLPTMHENFGHVIMESWQNGCPIIISDQTPWDELQEKHIGYSVPLSKPEAFVNKINFFAEMNEVSFNTWSKFSYDFAAIFTQKPQLVIDTKKLFK